MGIAARPHRLRHAGLASNRVGRPGVVAGRCADEALLRMVRLEFAGGIAAEISREQYARQKDNKGWQVELPPAALRVF